MGTTPSPLCIQFSFLSISTNGFFLFVHVACAFTFPQIHYVRGLRSSRNGRDFVYATAVLSYKASTLASREYK